jgi:hypothetical protein
MRFCVQPDGWSVQQAYMRPSADSACQLASTLASTGTPVTILEYHASLFTRGWRPRVRVTRGPDPDTVMVANFQ